VNHENSVVYHYVIELVFAVFTPLFGNSLEEIQSVIEIVLLKSFEIIKKLEGEEMA
jgi:hypothetical protein